MKKMIAMVVAVAALAVMVPATDAVAQETIQVQDGCGTILKAVNNTVVARIDGTNKVRVFRNISPEVHFIVNGKKASVYELREGMHACAYHLETVAAPTVIFIEEHEVQTIVDEPDMHDTPKAPAPAPAAKPAPKPAPMPAALPRTASSLPLTGLAGLALLALSLGIGVLRRF
jgi:hypothetical protein